MPLQSPAISRRQLLQGASMLTAGAVAPGWAQPGKAAASRAVVVAQVVDFSQAQQDVSKDFLIGSRAAWQDINSRGHTRPTGAASCARNGRHTSQPARGPRLGPGQSILRCPLRQCRRPDRQPDRHPVAPGVWILLTQRPGCKTPASKSMTRRSRFSRRARNRSPTRLKPCRSWV